MNLRPAKIENYSGYYFNWHGKLPPLRKNNYIIIEDKSVGGDAPKDFIIVYEYGSGLRSRPNTWPAYIAKVGHKWYPMESITEYLLNRIGEVLGLEMAFSRLMVAGEQIRFLSRYFLTDHEQLVHGAQVFSGYLEDEEMVEQIEREQMSRDLFTFQFVEASFRHQFPEYASSLLNSFVKLLVFDAIIGNNDRHFYNWGIITDITGKIPPRFSPIYDTARGLFWNVAEHQINERLKKPKEMNDFLKKYLNRSLPKTGWEEVKNINHFNLIELLFKKDQRYCDVCSELLNFEKLNAVIDLLNKEFSTLMSIERRQIIEQCLTLRYEQLNAVCNA
jgi:hypothetical protein